MPCDVGAPVDLWAMAAELERQFAGYKQRLAERNGGAALGHGDEDAAAACDDGGGGGDSGRVDEEGAGGRGSWGDERGRMYEAYVRRRDERLREGWRARMERKEAEVKALWAQLELTARAGAAAERAPAPVGDEDGGAVGRDDERKTARNDDHKRRSSDDALAPRRITGKKHARTRSFSSSITTSRGRADVGRRRALSQEPPPAPSPEPQPRKDKRVRPAGGVATPAAPVRPRTSLRRKSSVKGHGTASKPAAGPKLPRSLPRRASSGSLEDLGRGPVVPPNADADAPVPSRSREYHAVPGGSETPTKASPPAMFVVQDDSGGDAGAASARATSPESDHGEVVEATPDGEPEAGNADAEERGEEKVDVSFSPDKLDNSNGEITSDSETEPSYVYVNKDTAEAQAMTLSGPLKTSASDSGEAKTEEEENADEVTAPPAEGAAAEVATMNAEEAPARESSDESCFSARSGQRARPSCSSRDQSVERLLEADAVLVRKKREQRAEKRAPKTPGSAGSRFSGTARSPRDTVWGFKRFLSFGKKNRGREVTVIDCTSPSVPSLADDDSASSGWQSAGSIKPRMGSSDAASDDTDHGYPVSPRDGSLQSLVAASPAKSELAEIVPQEKSPKAHRSFFSFRSLNCGRG